MIRDKRKGPRRALRYTAWISPGPKKLYGCVVADISDFGARLQVEKAADFPDEFVLLLSAKGKPKRKCRVVWRNATQLGVEFERRLSQADKNRPILKAEAMTPPLPSPDEPDLVETETTEPA